MVWLPNWLLSSLRTLANSACGRTRRVPGERRIDVALVHRERRGAAHRLAQVVDAGDEGAERVVKSFCQVACVCLESRCPGKAAVDDQVVLAHADAHQALSTIA